MRAAILLFVLFACAKPTSDSTPDTNVAMTITRDIAYKTLPEVDKNLLSLDVYAPEQAKDLPVLIFVHGGGWRMGDKSNQMKTKPSFFTGLGYVFVSVNYRLSPDIQHPEHVRDVSSSIAWVHQNITRYGGDPNRLLLMGHSAGAHLAALVATDESYLREDGVSLNALRGVVLLDGAGYDIPAQMEENRGKNQALYEQAFGEDPTQWKSASPYYHLAPNKGIPPFFLVHAGEREASAQQAKKLAAGLSQAGASAEVFHAPEKDHSGVNQDVSVPGDKMSDAIVAFLRVYSQ